MKCINVYLPKWRYRIIVYKGKKYINLAAPKNGLIKILF